ncbi:hypothetical protein HanRHA438_Chr10g0438051 [Helianthus annuus]|nr:hypothetical protein HanRHA438_Chr10g0438051 [Helianthus annuus]
MASGLEESLSAKLGPPLYSSLRVCKNVGPALCLVKILCLSLSNFSTHHASLTAIQGIRIAKVRGVSSSFVFVPKLEHASCYIIAVDMSMSSHKSKIVSCLRTCLTIRLVIIIHCIPFQQAL